MAFMNKEELASEAARLGIDISDLTYQQAQGVVSKAQASTGSSPPSPNKGRRKSPLGQYAGKTVLISPEMAPTKIQLIKYDEDLGEDLKLKEQEKLYPGILKQYDKERIDTTVQAVGKTGKRSIAESTLPKINVEITFRPDKDIVPVGRFQGRTGYMWGPIKELLVKSGYWEEYKNKFQGNDHDVFYLGGKQLFCNIQLVHAVLKEIERKEKKRRKFDDFDQ